MLKASTVYSKSINHWPPCRAGAYKTVTTLWRDATWHHECGLSCALPPLVGMTLRVLSSVTIPTVSAIRGRASWSGQHLVVGTQWGLSGASSVKRPSAWSVLQCILFQLVSHSWGWPSQCPMLPSQSTLYMHYYHYFLWTHLSTYSRSLYCSNAHSLPGIAKVLHGWSWQPAGTVTYSRHHLEATWSSSMDLLMPKRTHRHQTLLAQGMMIFNEYNIYVFIYTLHNDT